MFWNHTQHDILHKELTMVYNQTVYGDYVVEWLRKYSGHFPEQTRELRLPFSIFAG